MTFMTIDENKTQAQLIVELQQARKRVAEVEKLQKNIQQKMTTSTSFNRKLTEVALDAQKDAFFIFDPFLQFRNEPSDLSRNSHFLKISRTRLFT